MLSLLFCYIVGAKKRKQTEVMIDEYIINIKYANRACNAFHTLAKRRVYMKNELFFARFSIEEVATAWMTQHAIHSSTVQKVLAE